MLSGCETIAGAQIKPQIARYAPMVNALGKAVRAKQRPALAPRTSSAAP
jgi:hypothetical protein